MSGEAGDGETESNEGKDLQYYTDWDLSYLAVAGDLFSPEGA